VCFPWLWVQNLSEGANIPFEASLLAHRPNVLMSGLGAAALGAAAARRSWATLLLLLAGVVPLAVALVIGTAGQVGLFVGAALLCGSALATQRALSPHAA
jgi:hypothetical protein